MFFDHLGQRLVADRLGKRQLDERAADERADTLIGVGRLRGASRRCRLVVGRLRTAGRLRFVVRRPFLRRLSSPSLFSGRIAALGLLGSRFITI